VAGCGEVGLQVVDRSAGGGVGEGEAQVAAVGRLGVAVEVDPDSVDHRRARAVGHGHRSGRGAAYGDDLPGMDVTHLASLPELGVDDVVTGGVRTASVPARGFGPVPTVTGWRWR
jgi:hypothetical protein